MDLGIFNIDDSLYVPLQCVNGTGVAATPTGTPTWRVYVQGTTAAVANGNFDASDQDSQTGLRNSSQITLSAANGYAIGHYYVRGEYAVSGSTYTKDFSFQIV